jgi:hypothetical protein
MGRNGDIGAYESGNVKIIRVESNNCFANLKESRASRLRRPMYPDVEITAAGGSNDASSAIND